MKKNYAPYLLVVSFLCLVLAGSAVAATQQRVVIPYAVENSTWWSGIAVHNETDDRMDCYISIYDEDGDLIDGACFSVDPKAMYVDLLKNFVSAKVQGRVSAYIRTNEGSGWSTPFSVTLFMGNDEAGFGFETFQSEDYAAMVVICGGIIGPLEPF